MNPVETYPTLGELMRAARGEMKQQEYAYRLGYTQATISAWETGKSKPSEFALQSVAVLTGFEIVILKDGYKLIRGYEG